MSWLISVDCALAEKAKKETARGNKEKRKFLLIMIRYLSVEDIGGNSQQQYDMTDQDEQTVADGGPVFQASFDGFPVGWWWLYKESLPPHQV